jgi:predicted permease
MVDALRQDVRYAARALRARPALTTVAVLSLALGIGVNTAIFSVFEHLLLRRLPVPAADEIVHITAPGPRPGGSSTNDSGGLEAIFSHPLFTDLERIASPTLTGVAGHADFAANLALRGQTAEAEGLLVSGGYFPTLGLAPVHGRLLRPADDRVGAEQVAVLSHRYWTRWFAADPGVVGERAVVNGAPVTIVGIAPEGFTGTTVTDVTDVFVPLVLATAVRPGTEDLSRRDDHWVYAFGRLAPGLTRDRAQVALNGPFTTIVRDVEVPALKARLRQDQVRPFAERRIVLEDGARGRNRNRDETQVIAGLLLTVTGLVLLIACANVANLLLGRVTDRSAEIAVRFSLGATSGRVVRLLLAEAALLGLAGGIAALPVARAANLALFALVPPSVAVVLPEGLNRTVLLFALATGVGTGLVFGLFPALHFTSRRRRPDATIGQGGRAQSRSSASRSAARFRTALATAQIALATALLGEAGLLVANLSNLARVDLGMQREGVVTFRIAPGQNGNTSQQSQALFERVGDALRAVPGVVAASASTVTLLASSEWASNVTVQGVDVPDDRSSAYYAMVGADYFRTLGIPVLAGREFTAADAGAEPTVAIVNEAFVRQFGLGDRAVGARMQRGRSTRPFNIEIVGVVRDAKYSEVRDEIRPQFFHPYRQSPAGRLTYYVRTTGDTRALIAAIPSLVARIDPNLPVADLWTLDDQVWDNTTAERLLATLTSAFAGLAALLAAIGLYAVLAYTVARRNREFGIRIALGAAPAAVRRLVLTHVGRMTVSGLAVGLAIAVALGRLGESMLFGVDAVEPGILGAAAVLVASVALVAGIIPARRAAAVPAATALRAE